MKESRAESSGELPHLDILPGDGDRGQWACRNSVWAGLGWPGLGWAGLTFRPGDDWQQEAAGAGSGVSWPRVGTQTRVRTLPILQSSTQSVFL